MTMKKIQFFDATVITCGKYAKEVLGNDLSGLTGGWGGGGEGGGCGCGGGGSDSLLTLEILYEDFNDMDEFEAEFYNHDTNPTGYYDALTGVFNQMGIPALVNDNTIEYLKSIQNPIIAVDGEIIAMGRIPEDFELLDAIDDGVKVSVGAPKGF